MYRHSLRCAVTTVGLLLVGALGCRSSSCPTDTGHARSQSTASGAAGGEGDVRVLMLDLFAANACARISGTYLPLSASGSMDVVEGRLRVEQCSTERTQDAVTLHISGTGYRFIDREKEKLGAHFEVSQYARFRASLDATGATGLSYAQAEKVLSLWFQPRSASADVTPVGNLEVTPEGLWGTALGAVASVLGMAPEEQAQERVATRGSRAFEQKIEKGYTIGVDLCTTQRHSHFGRLQPQDLPEPPHPTNDQVWLANQRVRLHAGGVDLAGPFDPSDDVLRIEMRGADEGALQARLVCEQVASQLMDRFMQDQALPDIDAVDQTTVSPNELAHLQGNTERCPLVLVTTPADGVSGSVTYELMAYSEGDDRKELVPCKD